MAGVTVIVGQLASMTRAEAARVIRSTGGEPGERVTRATSIVVVGGRGPQFDRHGRPVFALARAERLADEGVPLRIVSEEEWLRSVGLSDEAAGIHRRFTAGQLAETLRIPRRKFDRWVASGLIPAVETSAGLPLFDFQQAASARTLCELLDAGVSPAKVRRAVADLGQRAAGSEHPLLELSFDETIRRLVVRTDDGRPVEPSGQLLLEFGPATSVEAIRLARREAGTEFDADAEAFRRARALEEERPQEAAAVYRELIERSEPNATLEFNLGNALMAAGDVAGAIEHYHRAAELEPHDAGVWNNLGNALAESDRPEEAGDAYRRALAADPGLADARFNLAQTLVELERPEEAVLHWRAYLAVDDDSTWAEYARERLAEGRGWG
jgi:tetratricopeptide (TPR) repeat protein